MGRYTHGTYGSAVPLQGVSPWFGDQWRTLDAGGCTGGRCHQLRQLVCSTLEPGAHNTAGLRAPTRYPPFLRR